MRLFTNGKFILTTLFLTTVVSIYVLGYSGGITGVTKKNGNGCTCHGNSPTAAVSVVIDGPASLLPGQTETYTVTVTGGPLVAAGTNIAASAGSLTPGAGLRLASSELTHQEPHTVAAGKVVFTFTYTAPATEGAVTLYANGNSVNLNGANSNDQWNFAQNKTISVSSATDIESEKYNLSYPSINKEGNTLYLPNSSSRKCFTKSLQHHRNRSCFFSQRLQTIRQLLGRV